MNYQQSCSACLLSLLLYFSQWFPWFNHSNDESAFQHQYWLADTLLSFFHKKKNTITLNDTCDKQTGMALFIQCLALLLLQEQQQTKINKKVPKIVIDFNCANTFARDRLMVKMFFRIWISNCQMRFLLLKSVRMIDFITSP